MLYFDTSFLAPLILPESTSARITKFVRRLSAVELAVSHWTKIEFSSLIARKVRTGELSAEEAARAGARFEIMAGDSFAVFLPDADDFGLAKRYLGKFETGLRAGDALHLAIGIVLVAILLALSRPGRRGAAVRAVAPFWHFASLVWIAILAILYVWFS